MSAPYHVNWYGGADDFVGSLNECLDYVRGVASAGLIDMRGYTLTGDNAEGGYGDDGLGFDDDLTDEESERFHAALEGDK